MTTNASTKTGLTCGALLLLFSGIALAFCSVALSGPASATNTDVQKIKHLIATYVTAVDRADTTLATQIWSDAPEASFIHPRGEEHGRAQIVENVFRHLMGDTFSERKFTPKNVSIHVYGDAAWAEFNWDFVAKVRKDGSPFHSQGRETEVFHKEGGHWRFVHVHYSGMPVTGNLKGF
ncbi:MAG: YybH family protein [Candidatus Acidiferrales bacterium]